MSEAAVATQDNKPKTIFDIVSSPQYVAQLRMALPRTGVTAERMARVAMTELRNNPTLQRCNPHSLLASIMVSAQLGLEPGSHLGLAYLIPYGAEATFQLGYKGLLQLLWRSEQIASVAADVVRERDDFTFSKGIAPKLSHTPARGERGEVTHVYAVIGTTSGGWLFEVWTKEQVEEHRKRYAKSRKDSPWEKAWDAMAKKTLLKQAAKYAPISTEAQAAVAADDRGEIGAPPEVDVTDLGSDDLEEKEPSRSQSAKDTAAKAAERAKGGEPEQGELGK